jgi:hypothetical protein
MTPQIALLWALITALVAIALFAASSRLGKPRASAWLVVFGLVLLAAEEPLLTLFWAMSPSSADRDGMSDLIPPPALAHVIDAAVFGSAFLVLLGWVALTGLRRGERWARRILFGAWIVVAATLSITAVAVYARGLPLPTAGGRAAGAGFGWEQLTVALLAWAGGLWLSRSTPSADSRR